MRKSTKIILYIIATTIVVAGFITVGRIAITIIDLSLQLLGEQIPIIENDIDKYFMSLNGFQKMVHLGITIFGIIMTFYGMIVGIGSWLRRGKGDK